jgi:hypothetical protein
MVNEKDAFAKYKSKVIYKTIAKHFEKYFINSLITPDDALILLANEIDKEDSFKKSLVHLKTILNKTGINKYREQYRQFKYRLKNDFKTIKVRNETYDKIKTLSENFGGIDDLLFEYAFDKHYYIDTQLINDLPTALTEKEQLLVLLEKVDYRVKKLIDFACQQAFEDGFIEGQSTKKIRSKKGMTEAVDNLDYECHKLMNE